MFCGAIGVQPYWPSVGVSIRGKPGSMQWRINECVCAWLSGHHRITLFKTDSGQPRVASKADSAAHAFTPRAFVSDVGTWPVFVDSNSRNFTEVICLLRDSSSATAPETLAVATELPEAKS